MKSESGAHNPIHTNPKWIPRYMYKPYTYVWFVFLYITCTNVQCIVYRIVNSKRIGSIIMVFMNIFYIFNETTHIAYCRRLLDTKYFDAFENFRILNVVFPLFRCYSTNYYNYTTNNGFWHAKSHTVTTVTVR